jgi:hypothetical protein
MTEVLYRRIAERSRLPNDADPGRPAPTWKEVRWFVNRDPHTSQRLNLRRRDA